MKIALVICTRNPRLDFLQRVLNALRNQTLPKSEWALLIVDNGSAEPLSGRLDLSWHSNGRIVREERTGIAFARLRGIAETESDLIVFVDDDNVLDTGYLRESLAIAEASPHLGAWGCSIVPEYEVQPAAHLRPYLKFLALREVTSPRWSNVWNCTEAEPWGAGLTIRRIIALAYRDFYHNTPLRVNGRSGDILLSGEDTEIAYVTCRVGYGIGVFPTLKLLHIIPRRRVSEEYLLKIVQGTTTSSMLLHYKWAGIKPESPTSFIALGKLAKALLLQRGFERKVSITGFRAKIAAKKIIEDSQRSQTADPADKPS